MSEEVYDAVGAIVCDARGGTGFRDQAAAEAVLRCCGGVQSLAAARSSPSEARAVLRRVRAAVHPDRFVRGSWWARLLRERIREVVERAIAVFLREPLSTECAASRWQHRSDPELRARALGSARSVVCGGGAEVCKGIGRQCRDAGDAMSALQFLWQRLIFRVVHGLRNGQELYSEGLWCEWEERCRQCDVCVGSDSGTTRVAELRHLAGAWSQWQEDNNGGCVRRGPDFPCLKIYLDKIKRQ